MPTPGSGITPVATAAGDAGRVPDGPWVQTLYRARDQVVILVTGQGSQETGMFLVPLKEFVRLTGLTADEIKSVQPPTPDAALRQIVPFHEIARGALPADLSGKTVMDVGGYAGEFARYCIERGAARVRIIDNGEWQSYGWRPPPLPEGVSRIGCDVLEWQEEADLVICGNVVYHARDPWRFLYHLRSLCRERLLLWTSFVLDPGPVWRVITPEVTGAGTKDDYLTVHWKPSVAGLFALLARTGWVNATEVGRDGDHIVVMADPR
jgi:hypothetical protein